MTNSGLSIRARQMDRLSASQGRTFRPALTRKDGKANVAAMIKVQSRPTVEHNPQGGWQTVFSVGETFDYSTPFRATLANIANVLSQQLPTSIELPAYEDREDFVEGTLQFGGETIRTYYEHSLSYLALMSDSANTLRKIVDYLEPHVTVA